MQLKKKPHSHNKALKAKIASQRESIQSLTEIVGKVQSL